MELIKFIILFIALEFILGVFYFYITPKSIRTSEIIDHKSLIKGIVERAFLMISLINGFPHALTLFGALKLGTRLKRENSEKINEATFNDFYLIGNFISVMAAMFYTFLYTKFV